MLGDIKNASSGRWSGGNKDQNFYNRGQGIKPVAESLSQSRWKGQFCKQNKLVKSANFVSKFKVKHVIKEQSQSLEESQNCFESRPGEGFTFVDLNFD